MGADRHMKPRVLFVTKTACELCEAGRSVVDTAAGWLRFEVDVVDVSTDERFSQYTSRLPVVLDGTGESLLLEGRITLGQALSALLRRRISAG